MLSGINLAKFFCPITILSLGFFANEVSYTPKGSFTSGKNSMKSDTVTVESSCSDVFLFLHANSNKIKGKQERIFFIYYILVVKNSEDCCTYPFYFLDLSKIYFRLTCIRNFPAARKTTSRPSFTCRN